MPTKKTSIAILGAGISGLSLAFSLKKEGLDLQILEACASAGGFIEAPQIFQTQRSPHLLKLIEDLGLKEELRFSLESHDRYILKKGKLEKIPRSLWGFLTSPLTKGSILSLLKELRIPPNSSDESVYDFGVRRFGKALTEHFLDPLCVGVFAGSMEKLSIKACFPFLKKLEEQGSVFKAVFKTPKKTSSLFTLQGGMELLTKTLSKELAPQLQFSQDIVRMEKTPQGSFALTNSQGEILTTKNVFMALSLPATWQLLSSFDPELAGILGQIPSKGVHVVTLTFAKTLREVKGFGYLVPQSENLSHLGVIFSSDVFANANEERFIVMVKEEVLNPLEVALHALRQYVGVVEAPGKHEVRYYEKAIPQYPVGHAENMETLFSYLEKHHPGLYILGNFIEGVSVNSCIQLAEKIAKNYFMSFSH